MSKSRGNVVAPDEVVYGVYQADGYEFRDLLGEVVDLKTTYVWRNPGQGYRTTKRYGNQPVFLHEAGNPIPAFLDDGLQHAEELEFWLDLLEKYEDE
jgi:hypothetical protein